MFFFSSSKCHISDIGIDKLSLEKPSQDKLSPATQFQAPLCIRYSRCAIHVSALTFSKVMPQTFGF